ncbi:keratin-associated protein 6-2-like [Chrysoperla carnea]|uniref:keratin-associated protein 6-2-like n=1 Tax=Chrysoperla carnea TaxID=189513 RepID=UPI001D077C37|nr:keratin-associated protein 6-2-like [Chrysoperla carnea]
MLPQTLVAFFAIIGLALAGTEILNPVENNGPTPFTETGVQPEQTRAKRFLGTKLLLGAGAAGLAGAAIGGGLVAKKALVLGGLGAAAYGAKSYGGYGYGSGYGYGHGSYGGSYYAPSQVHHYHHSYPSSVTYVSTPVVYGGYGHGGYGSSYGYSSGYSSGYASAYGHGGVW